MAASWPASRLSRLLLPALGGPTMAMRTPLLSHHRAHSAKAASVDFLAINAECILHIVQLAPNTGRAAPPHRGKQASPSTQPPSPHLTSSPLAAAARWPCSR
jgi:hypothetical protein